MLLNGNDPGPIAFLWSHRERERERGSEKEREGEREGEECGV